MVNRQGVGLPLSSTSRSEARIFCCSMLGAFGSKRPSFCAFFQARTLSVRVSYSVDGMTYLSTAERSEKSVRAAGGLVSTTYAQGCQNRTMFTSSQINDSRALFDALPELIYGLMQLPLERGKLVGGEARIARKRKMTGEEAMGWYDDRVGQLEASSTCSQR
jgi:hypothetical protein